MNSPIAGASITLAREKISWREPHKPFETEGETMRNDGEGADKLPNRSAGPVDLHIGQKLRTRRAGLGISQWSLGESVGITFQQIQKYERGSNRISASRLYAIADVLSVPVSYFFDGLPDPTGSNAVGAGG